MPIQRLEEPDMPPKPVGVKCADEIRHLFTEVHDDRTTAIVAVLLRDDMNTVQFDAQITGTTTQCDLLRAVTVMLMEISRAHDQTMQETLRHLAKHLDDEVEFAPRDGIDQHRH